MKIPVTSEVEIYEGARVGGHNPFFVIAGPCVIESEELLNETAISIKETCSTLGLPFYFKSSFDKANRSSFDSFRGPGLVEGLKMLSAVKKSLGVKLLTDVHEISQVDQVAETVDMLQIPAFLCRQTDLIQAAAETGKWVNIKKGQFMAPRDALILVEKFKKFGNDKIMICERGYTFGYNNLVVDMRSIEILRSEGVHVVLDATHSTQLPGGGKQSGGQREMAYPLARAAAAVGIDGYFIEVHPDPMSAKSDSTNQLYLDTFSGILETCLKIDRVIKER